MISAERLTRVRWSRRVSLPPPGSDRPHLVGHRRRRCSRPRALEREVHGAVGAIDLELEPPRSLGRERELAARCARWSYGAAPHKRLAWIEDGRISYRLKRPWPDGRTHLPD